MASNINPVLQGKFDEMLMQITQQAGNGIDGLLDTVMSFLQRRTDFFYEAEPGDKMGFPPQYAEGLVSAPYFLRDHSWLNVSPRVSLNPFLLPWIDLPLFQEVLNGAREETPAQRRH